MGSKLEMPLHEFNWLAETLTNQTYRWAKSKSNPHCYTLRETWKNDDDFVRAVTLIRKYGYINYFWGKPYTQIDVNDYFYWTMGEPINLNGKWHTILINAKPLGIHNAYDNIAASYDELFKDPDSIHEEIEVMKMIGHEGGSVLDIGCGTGLFMDYNSPEMYLGIDPSMEMLNQFRKKHEGVDLVNTDFRRFYDSRKFDYVISLFGSASYLIPQDLRKLMHYTGTDGKLFLMFYKQGYYPVTYQKTGIKETFLHLEEGFKTEIFGNFEILKLQREGDSDDFRYW